MADKDNKNEEVVVTPGPRVMVVPGNDLTGYLGVSPEYMNYANPTEKPILTEEEAMLFTNLSDEQIEATRSHESEFENEAPAVAEAGEDEVSSVVGQAATRYATTEGVNVDPEGNYTHPQVFEDDEEEGGLTGEQKADIAQGVKKAPGSEDSQTTDGDQQRDENQNPDGSGVQRPVFNG